MLEEYEKALDAKDWKTVARIEKDLARLGMDKLTLSILVNERKKTKKIP